MILSITFKVKFMFEHAVLYIIFNMATSNINKMGIYNKKTKPVGATAFKTKLKQHCSDTAIFLKKLTLFYLWVIITKICSR